MPKNTKLVKYGNEDIASKANIDDIEGWDIPLKEVKSVYMHTLLHRCGSEYLATGQGVESLETRTLIYHIF